MIAHITQRIHETEDIQDLVASADKIISEYGLPDDHRRVAYTAACCLAIDEAISDGFLSEQEEYRIVRFMELGGIRRDDMPDKTIWTKLVKMAVLRDVLNGLTPNRLNTPDAPHINLQKGESVIWAFTDCKYLEDRSRIQYQGGSQGVSLRVMKGVYYRVGAFKGERISTAERVHVDTGWVFITNKHIYFTGPKKSLRVAYPKIVSFMPFNDGIGVMRDAQTAKPQIFVTGDGWFSYNLVTNLAAQ